MTDINPRHTYHFCSLIFLAIIAIIAIGALSHLAIKNNTVVVYLNETVKNKH